MKILNRLLRRSSSTAIGAVGRSIIISRPNFKMKTSNPDRFVDVVQEVMAWFLALTIGYLVFHFVVWAAKGFEVVGR